MRGKGTGITTPTENEGIECKRKGSYIVGISRSKVKIKLEKKKTT